MYGRSFQYCFLFIAEGSDQLPRRTLDLSAGLASWLYEKRIGRQAQIRILSGRWDDVPWKSSAGIGLHTLPVVGGGTAEVQPAVGSIAIFLADGSILVGKTVNINVIVMWYDLLAFLPYLAQWLLHFP